MMLLRDIGVIHKREPILTEQSKDINLINVINTLSIEVEKNKEHYVKLLRDLNNG